MRLCSASFQPLIYWPKKNGKPNKKKKSKSNPKVKKGAMITEHTLGGGGRGGKKKNTKSFWSFGILLSYFPLVRLHPHPELIVPVQTAFRLSRKKEAASQTNSRRRWMFAATYEIIPISTPAVFTGPPFPTTSGCRFIYTKYSTQITSNKHSRRTILFVPSAILRREGEGPLKITREKPSRTFQRSPLEDTK